MFMSFCPRCGITTMAVATAVCARYCQPDSPTLNDSFDKTPSQRSSWIRVGAMAISVAWRSFLKR
jgi:hypothetical protein